MISRCSPYPPSSVMCWRRRDSVPAFGSWRPVAVLLVCVPSRGVRAGFAAGGSCTPSVTIWPVRLLLLLAMNTTSMCASGLEKPESGWNHHTAYPTQTKLAIKARIQRAFTNESTPPWRWGAGEGVCRSPRRGRELLVALLGLAQIAQGPMQHTVAVLVPHDLVSRLMIGVQATHTGLHLPVLRPSLCRDDQLVREKPALVYLMRIITLSHLFVKHLFTLFCL